MKAADRLVPGKRLRNWHRITNGIKGTPQPLRAYARMLAAAGSTGPDRERQAVAKAWLASKGARQ